jgi:hypothetical protein
LEGLGRGLRRSEIDEAVSSIATIVRSEPRKVRRLCPNLPRKLVANHLDTDLFTHLEPKITNKVLIDPWLKFTHPAALVSVAIHNSLGAILTHHKVVF